MNLFELIKIMFTNPEKYDKLKKSDKAGNHFMVQRMMAINHPIEAQKLNRNGIDGSAVIDTWQKVCKRYTRVPGWTWTKASKADKVKKEWKPSEQIAKFYMNRNNIGPREFDELLKYNGPEMKKFLKKIEKQIDVHSAKVDFK
jgi:hypothetical protein